MSKGRSHGTAPYLTMRSPVPSHFLKNGMIRKQVYQSAVVLILQATRLKLDVNKAHHGHQYVANSSDVGFFAGCKQGSQ